MLGQINNEYILLVKEVLFGLYFSCFVQIGLVGVSVDINFQMVQYRLVLDIFLLMLMLGQVLILKIRKGAVG